MTRPDLSTGDGAQDGTELPRATQTTETTKIGVGLFVAWAVHDLEELLTGPASSRALVQRVPSWVPLPDDVRHQGIGRRDLGTAIGIVGVLVAAAAASGVRSGCRSAFFQTVLQGFGWHGVGHVLISLALRRYTSGVATAPTVVIPYWLWARRALADSDVPLRPTDTKTVALVPPVIIGSIAVARVIGRHTR